MFSYIFKEKRTMYKNKMMCDLAGEGLYLFWNQELEIWLSNNTAISVIESYFSIEVIINESPV